MFKRFFSCMGETNELQQVDLSNQLSQNKPLVPQESNVVGREINFEVEDLQSQKLHQHFLQSAAFNSGGITTKHYYDQDDGEVESKITTASPSKTQYYKQQPDEYTPQLVLENQNNLLINPQQLIQQVSISLESQNSSATQQSLVVAMTEKKLQNYLQQAKFLMNTSNNNTTPPDNQSVNNNKKIKAQKQKNYSIDNEQQQQVQPLQGMQKLDSCPSFKVILSGANYQTSLNSQITESLQNKNLKNSFKSVKDGKSTKVDIRKSQSDKKPPKAFKPNTQGLDALSQQNISSRAKDQLQGFYSHRKSDASRQNAQGRLSVKNKTDTNAKQSAKGYKTVVPHNAHPKQIIDQLDNIIFEEDQFSDEHQQSQDEIELREQLKVLDFEDGQQQYDLGNIKSINKRQASKTEVFQPLSNNSHKKNKVSALPQSQLSLSKQISNNSKITQAPKTLHKKTSSHLPQINTASTRNNFLTKKHMTATTSPNERMSDLKVNHRLSSGQKADIQSKGALLALSNQKRLLKSNTHEIQEDQNEEDDNRVHESQMPHFQLQQREFDIINSTISPSSQSSFQFQPKFFKPTNLPQYYHGKNSLSMEEQHLTLLNLQQHQVFRKDSAKQL